MFTTLTLRLPTDTLLKLIAKLRKRGGSQDLSETITQAIEDLLADPARFEPGADTSGIHGYQWKTLFLGVPIAARAGGGKKARHSAEPNIVDRDRANRASCPIPTKSNTNTHAVERGRGRRRGHHCANPTAQHRPRTWLEPAGAA
jgi:hypothetical protein